MEKKISKKTIQKAEEKSIDETMAIASIEIRNCMFRVLQRLSREHPNKKFFFTGKHVESFDAEEDLSNLPF